MPSLLRRLPAFLTAVLATLVVAAPARAFEVAIQDDAVFVHHAWYDSNKAYDQAQALGATAIRINIIWSQYHRYGFPMYDQAVNTAVAHGLAPQITIMGTPRYDHGNRRISYYKPNAGRFGHWAATIANHFKGRVHRYSLWNEPNLAQFLSPHRYSARIYHRLYQAGYRAIKKVDPSTQVLFGELTSAVRPLTFLKQATGGLRSDGLAYHPFQFDVAPGRRGSRYVGISKVWQLRSLLHRLARHHRLSTPGGRMLPIYFTEFAYEYKGEYQMPESTRARWSVLAFDLAKRAHVRQMLWYQLVHVPKQWLVGDFWDSGLIGLGGGRTSTYRALVRAAPRLVGHTPHVRSPEQGTPSEPAPQPASQPPPNNSNPGLLGLLPPPPALR